YLRQVEKMQLDFVGNVSHELKTPVTAISGFAETLLGGAKNDPATLDRFLGIIYDESKRLTQLINDILTLSRPDSNQNVAASVALKKLVDDALHNLAKVIQDKQIRVEVAITPDLLVVTDERKLTQIVRNLLNNAVFYNRLAGHVTISAQVVDHQLSLAVADTGIGISETEQARIFERFYRVDKARSRHNGGTGLGLAIVAELVKSMDGHVAVHSQVGVGSTFTVTLPVGEGPHRG
ncbi:MAG: ATP-binding protein, partial [Lacticaseibacillus paracasei]|nr:ATP-binding protein [Lacticaseibacillus paracasei]